MLLRFLPRLFVLLSLLSLALAQNTRSDTTQNTRSDTVYLSMNLEQMLEFLDQSGFTVESGEDDDGEPYIEIKLGEFDPTLYLSDCNKKGQCTTLLLYYGMDLEEGVGLEVVNQFNLDHKFVQVFVDEDQDPWLASALDLTGGVTRKNIVNWINGFGQKLPEFSDTMEEAASANSLGNPLARSASTDRQMLLQRFWKNRLLPLI